MSQELFENPYSYLLMSFLSWKIQFPYDIEMSHFYHQASQTVDL